MICRTANLKFGDFLSILLCVQTVDIIKVFSHKLVGPLCVIAVMHSYDPFSYDDNGWLSVVINAHKLTRKRSFISFLELKFLVKLYNIQSTESQQDKKVSSSCLIVSG